MKSKLIYIFLFIVSLTACMEDEYRFNYNNPPLVLTADSLSDALGSFGTADLPVQSPNNKARLSGSASPITNKMWNIALHDVEQNLVTNDYGTYFAAGRRYTERVYTRDIAFAGILGLNAIYPEEMKRSLEITREVRSALGYKVSAPHVVKEINAPWEIFSESEKDVMAAFRTNSITRRTDDVVWVWAVQDLFTQNPGLADWEWLFETGTDYFENYYAPWFDTEDNLYKCQPAFQDIESTGYPDSLDIADCVLMKGTSTNCLYYKAMLSMAEAAEKSGQSVEKIEYWNNRAADLKTAILKELMLPDGTFTYYKVRYGNVMINQHNLGTAFAIIFGIVEGEAAKKAIQDYPVTDRGIPLIHPFLTDNQGPHNQASWPFCSTFFLWAKEIALKEDFTDYNAALLARTMGTQLAENRDKDWGGFGSFHEKVQLPSGIIDGSGQQLWTSAAYINVCLRAGIVEK
ncbi:MAG: hypothetical protein K9H49_06580 [Bacteroidales bacterium]|nr:hypothetical protein [Bacteroidales bacterium]MCF8389339.1 hypothetical protein [Bacteroidales bacterium]